MVAEHSETAIDAETDAFETTMMRLEQAGNAIEPVTTTVIGSLTEDKEPVARAQIYPDADEPHYLRFYEAGDYSAAIHIDVFTHPNRGFTGNIGSLAEAVHVLDEELDEFQLDEAEDWF